MSDQMLHNALNAPYQFGDMDVVQFTNLVNAAIRASDHIEELEAKLAMAVEALQTFKDFDDLPLECKRPDAFQIKVRKPILVTLAKLKGEKE
jgi:hypothetical protein